MKMILKKGGAMSTEVLSYFLKNHNRKLRLGFQIALQCAPLLKGLKVSCVISLDEGLYKELSELFAGMDIVYHMLSRSDGKCLVLFYRPGEMEVYLEDPKVQTLLDECRQLFAVAKSIGDRQVLKNKLCKCA